jgi:hypothetical protein
MPLHYALTDGLVALVAAWGVWRLLRAGQPIAALGLAMFGIAGAIGVTRITTGAGEALAPAHRFASQIGGVFGLWLIVSQIWTKRGGRASPALRLIVAAAIAGLAIRYPVVGAGGFVIGLVCGVALLWLGDGPGRRGTAAALGFGLMLPNVLLIRQSPLLGADLGWHLYHIVVAVWLALTVRALTHRPDVKNL